MNSLQVFPGREPTSRADFLSTSSLAFCAASGSFEFNTLSIIIFVPPEYLQGNIFSCVPTIFHTIPVTSEFPNFVCLPFNLRSAIFIEIIAESPSLISDP